MLASSLYPLASQLQLPLTPYVVAGYRFGQRVRRRWGLPAWHLGDDLIVPAGTSVASVGAGRVVWAAIRPGSPARRNWGGLVIIGHRRTDNQLSFYSLYGHLTSLVVTTGQEVAGGQPLGVVAAGLTPENGWWQKAHLHFAIYIGPWFHQVLPGYKRLWAPRTKMAWWAAPQKFIEQYNQRPV